MEIIIVICLLIVIILLLHDKVIIYKKSAEKHPHRKTAPHLPNIIGQPKMIQRLSLPSSADESQVEITEAYIANLDIEYDESENVSIQIPQEESDGVFGNISDLEEEEWQEYGISNSDNGFAQGVTYDELSSIGLLLQKENLEQSQKEIAAAVVQKLQGTELFSLLESSVEGASRKIAELLDNSLSSEKHTDSSILRNQDIENFDIEEFI